MENSHDILNTPQSEQRPEHKLKRTLFNIREDALALQDLLEERAFETEGDIGEVDFATIQKFWDEIETDLEGKLEGYANLILENEAREISLRARSNAILNLARFHGNVAKALKNRAVENLLAMDKKKITTETHDIAVQDNGGKRPLNLLAEVDQLPEELVYFQKVARIEELRNQLEKYFAALNQYRKEHDNCSEDEAALHIPAPEALKYATLDPQGSHLRIR